MLASKQRLDRKQFSAFFKQGRRCHGEYLTVIFKPGLTLCAAVVVSKKVFSQAHDRNSLRRKLYGWLYELSQRGLAGTLVIIVKPVVKSLTKQQTKQKLVAEIEAATIIR